MTMYKIILGTQRHSPSKNPFIFHNSQNSVSCDIWLGPKTNQGKGLVYCSLTITYLFSVCLPIYYISVCMYVPISIIYYLYHLWIYHLYLSSIDIYHFYLLDIWVSSVYLSSYLSTSYHISVYYLPYIYVSVHLSIKLWSILFYPWNRVCWSYKKDVMKDPLCSLLWAWHFSD